MKTVHGQGSGKMLRESPAEKLEADLLLAGYAKKSVEHAKQAEELLKQASEVQPFYEPAIRAYAERAQGHAMMAQFYQNIVLDGK